MILLDSDHLSVLRYPTSARSVRLRDRLEAAEDGPVATTVVSAEEAMRGWLSAIAKEKQFIRQVFAYRELAELFTFFSGFHLALFDESAATRCTELRASQIRIATMDLKIAAITLARSALLLTANRQDFELVPGLRYENWLD